MSTLQGHPQALQEDRSKSCLRSVALCDPKRLQLVKHLGSHNAMEHWQLLDVFLEGLRMTL